jgi:hypothetical protein
LGTVGTVQVGADAIVIENLLAIAFEAVAPASFLARIEAIAGSADRIDTAFYLNILILQCGKYSNRQGG